MLPSLISQQLEAETLAALQAQLEEAEKESAGSRAAVIQMEAQLINVACDDLGRLVWTSLLMPMLRERIESKAFQFNNKDVLLAEQQVSALWPMKPLCSQGVCCWDACIQAPHRCLHGRQHVIEPGIMPRHMGLYSHSLLGHQLK